MNALTFDEIKSLLCSSVPLCVSLYMPTQRGGLEAFENAVLLKNLLRKAEQELVQRGYGEAAIRALLKPAQAQVDDAAFWQHPGDGLAVFLAPGLIRYYQLPFSVADTVMVGSHFLIRPLLPFFSGDGQFYVLTLSQNAVRLLEGTRDGMQEIALEGVPQSLSEALQFDEPQADQSVNYNGGRPFPGNNEPKEGRKEKIARFFNKVDKALPQFITDTSAPLVLAGIEYEAAIYRQVASYPNLMEDSIAGNPERLSLRTLHERAWRIVQPRFQEAQLQAMARYAELNGTGLVSEDICEILPAAHCGRVATLFVATGPNLDGRYDPDTNRVTEHPVTPIGTEDLVNLAAIESLLHGGTIYAENTVSEVRPGSTTAIFRY